MFAMTAIGESWAGAGACIIIHIVDGALGSNDLAPHRSQLDFISTNFLEGATTLGERHGFLEQYGVFGAFWIESIHLGTFNDIGV